MTLPEFLKKFPESVARLGAAVYRAMMASGGDDAKAQATALEAIAARYTNQNGDWIANPVQSIEHLPTIPFRAAQAADDKSGLKWEAVLIAPGPSRHATPYYWDESVLEQSVDLFQGIDVNAYEINADTFSHLTISSIDALEEIKRYLTGKKVGWVEKAWYEAGTGIKAIINILPEHDWLPKALEAGAAQGNPDVLGLSIDTRIKGYPINLEGWSAIWVEKIKNVSSVDVVSRPAAGGKFIRALMAQEEDTIMTYEQLLALIQKNRPDLLEGKDQAQMSMEDLTELAQMAMTPQDKGNSMNTPSAGEGAASSAPTVTGVTQEELNKQIQAVEARAACSIDLNNQLAGSDLPAPAAARIRTAYEGKVFEPAQLTKAIKDEKDYIAAMSQPLKGPGGDPRSNVGFGQVEKIQLACDRMFGLTQENLTEMAQMSTLNNQPFFDDMRAAQDIADHWAAAPPIGGLHELYVTLTGDSRVTGRFMPQNLPMDLRAAQDVTSSTFAYALGNTMSRRLVADYKALDFLESMLISLTKPVKDFRTQEAVSVGYFPDIETVDPETGDYNEITGVTDEEASYSLGQKGNILTITRKTIINDDLSLIQRLVGRLGRAFRRTHAKYVWNFFINNSNCADGTAWFTSGHGNLGAAALAYSTALIAYKALAGMTEKDSDEKIGLLAGGAVKPILITPIDLFDTGEMIANDDHYFTSNDLTTKKTNALKGKITHQSIDLLSDANDWGLILPSTEVDHVEMGYLNGRQEPEMFVSDGPTSEATFMGDKIRYKGRHEYAGTPVDHRGAYKAVVA